MFKQEAHKNLYCSSGKEDFFNMFNLAKPPPRLLKFGLNKTSFVQDELLCFMLRNIAFQLLVLKKILYILQFYPFQTMLNFELQTTDQIIHYDKFDFTFDHTK